MRELLRIEELALAVLAVFLFQFVGYAWWWMAMLFLAPDESMVGYLAGPHTNLGTI